jgi:lipoyl(octanoyl) transferase
MLLITRNLGRTDYQATLTKMQAFTNSRTAKTDDELWLTEHDHVYTLGLNRNNVRLPNNNIPVVNVDRGGKITYHGLGQVVIYLLIDLGRRGLKVRELVDIIEGSIIELLAGYAIKAATQKNAPGVYINNKKIASVGLRLKKNCCYHGLSLNVDMDLSPFSAIDPCGYIGLEMTQLKDWNIQQAPQLIGETLLNILEHKLSQCKN